MRPSESTTADTPSAAQRNVLNPVDPAAGHVANQGRRLEGHEKKGETRVHPPLMAPAIYSAYKRVKRKRDRTLLDITPAVEALVGLGQWFPASPTPRTPFPMHNARSNVAISGSVRMYSLHCFLSELARGKREGRGEADHVHEGCSMTSMRLRPASQRYCGKSMSKLSEDSDQDRNNDEGAVHRRDKQRTCNTRLLLWGQSSFQAGRQSSGRRWRVAFAGASPRPTVSRCLLSAPSVM